MAQVKILCGWIEMMELKSLLAARIAANYTPAPSLFNKLALHDPATPCHRFDPAANAAIKATSLEDELGRSMALAKHLRALWVASGPLTPATGRLDPS
jgi:hypothetical protein